MNPQLTGAVIKRLREANHMTQAELAAKLRVSDKAISKWETAKGCPDIALLTPIAEAFGISVAELLAGNAVCNANAAANMLRSLFYVCPVCGNTVHAMGEAVIHCHGMPLAPCQAAATDEAHRIIIENVEDEYYVRIEHAMTKEHYISFAAALSPDRVQMVKFYPEGNAQARFQMRGVQRILFYCVQDGLFYTDLRPYRARPAA